MYQTEIFNAPSELERLLWTIDKGTENYYRREGLEDFGCVTMKSQHKANNTLMIPATHYQLIGGQFIPCWQRLIPLRPENHVKND